MALALTVTLPLLLCWLPVLERRAGWRHGSAWLAAAVTLASAGCLAAAWAGAEGPGPEVVAIPWMPGLGLALSLRLDGLSFLFCVLVLGIGLLVVVYARSYLASDDHAGRFLAFLLLFMGSMLGVVTAENLLGLVVFWELTSLSSFLLVGFKNEKAEARRGARRALGVTGLGGLALLGSVLLLGEVVGSFELTDVLTSRAEIVAHPWYPAIVGLLLLGAFAKSAQLPFQFWLPGAMSAPTPASAYLHSATMVKAGVFLLARLWPALAGTELWFWLVAGIGLATMLFGAVVALFQGDIKGLLAYSTISHLGLITALFGLGTETAVVAGLFHILNHACFKASLFMAAGIVDHETGTRDLDRLGGLALPLRSTAILASVASAAMAGVPLLNGFLSKEMFFEETVGVGAGLSPEWLLPAVAAIGGAFSVGYSVRFAWDIFFRPATGQLERTPHTPPVWMVLPVGVLVAICVAIGVAPNSVATPLLERAAHSVLGADTPVIDIHIWHGFTLPLLMSAAAIVVGLGLYGQREAVSELKRTLLPTVDGPAVYDTVVGGFFRVARFVTDLLHEESLPRYVAALVASALVVASVPFAWAPELEAAPIHTPAPPALVAFVLLAALGAVATLRFHRQRLLALVTIGLTGLGSTLVFVELSAPDLALTQLSVEFATTVLFLLALYHLPSRSPSETGAGRRARDAALAGAVGAGLAALLYGVLTRPFDTIADYYLATAKSHGGGTNVVNVILVDYRGFDTLGEITVLGIAALGVAAMLHEVRIPRTATSEQGRVWSADKHPFLLRVMSRPMLPLLLLVAVYITLRGHNLPGGGFVGGLIAGIALILQFMAGGLSFATRRLRFDFVSAAAVGLLIAAGAGLASMAFGWPLLTSTFTHVRLGPIEFELASAMVFDVGVFVTVVAVLLIILSRLGRIGSNTPNAEAETEGRSG